jgi:1-acyl-sn-glycerol-3-phosphate acyltransferase
MVTREATTQQLLSIAEQLALELHPEKKGSFSAKLDSPLERDMGLDSLARAELLLRVERDFGVGLPEQLLATAETPRDLLRAVLAAPGAAQRVPAPSAVRGRKKKAQPERAPAEAATLQEVLNWHVRAHPERRQILLSGDNGQKEEIRYRELEEGALKVAAGLLADDLTPGNPVAIMLATGREYFYSFLGILVAGGVPVPIYPPLRASQLEDHLRRHTGILLNAQAFALVTLPEAKNLARLLKTYVPSLRTVATVEELSRAGGIPTPCPAKPDDIALLQYTSGSTGNPKGVVLTHSNLLANIRTMGRALNVSSRDVFVSWLPLYHDMGLIGAWLGSLYYGFTLSVMSPLAFLARPQRWLWAIHEDGGTLSGGPNFAYELCLRKIQDRDIDGLDLSTWRFAFNGAEPVNASTIQGFAKRFARYGFKPGALAPVYGLAESSVGLAFPPAGRGLVVDRIKRTPFTESEKAIPAAKDEPDVLCFVACGRPLPGHEIRIVDAAGRELPEREQGRLEFKGPSSTSGYYRNPDETRGLFHGDWLDSGDYAYLAEGDVYLTGRAKDVIIRAGRNIHPQQLEEAVGDLPGIRKGCVAVFGTADPATGTERVVVLAETREEDPASCDGLRRQINNLALDLLGVPLDDIVLTAPHTVPKTSSGKIRRAASKERYESGTLHAPQRALWLQVARVAWSAMRPQFRRIRRAAYQLLYAAWVWAVFWAMAPATWLAACSLPRPAASWWLSARAARLFLRLAGIPLMVEGMKNLPREENCVLAANHASYLDGIVLIAALPRQFAFVAKRELKEHFVSRLYLTRIGAEFVERFDPQRGIDDTGRLARLARAGASLAFFPEGTFQRMPGLASFHMGAFVAAAEAGLPVVPVTLRGTRSLLRVGHWLPRRGAARVIIGRPIAPQGKDWAAAVKLRETIRRHILQACGEPDLGETG